MAGPRTKSSPASGDPRPLIEWRETSFVRRYLPRARGNRVGWPTWPCSLIASGRAN
jgi:hypothetical protein